MEQASTGALARDPLAPLTDPRPGDKLQGPVVGLEVTEVTQVRTEQDTKIARVLCSLYKVSNGEYIGDRSFTIEQYRAFTRNSRNVEVLHVAD